MIDPPSLDDAIIASELLRQSRRNRWAFAWAAFLAANHFTALMFVFGWYYWIVPRSKFQIDSMGVYPRDAALLLIQQSDLIVNYWHFLAMIGLLLLISDFVIMEWMSKQLGLTRTLLFAIFVAILILMNVAVGNHILSEEIARLQK